MKFTSDDLDKNPNSWYDYETLLKRVEKALLRCKPCRKREKDTTCPYIQISRRKDKYLMNTYDSEILTPFFFDILKFVDDEFKCYFKEEEFEIIVVGKDEPSSDPVV